MMAIKLANSHLMALVNDEDHARLAEHEWRVNGFGYAFRSVREDGRKQILFLHRAVLGGEQEIDHINRDKMDNRRGNLRFVTRSQQMQNRRVVGECGFKGVKREHNRWRARIQVEKKSINLGSHDTAADAARAYNAAAVRYFGPNAYQNAVA